MNPAGCLYWPGRNWFVREALAGQRVRVERVGQLLLLSYGHMYLREIDRSQRCTRPLVLPLDVGFSMEPQGTQHNPL